MLHRIAPSEYQPTLGHFVSPPASRWMMHLLTLFAVCGLARDSVAQEQPLASIGTRVRLTLQGTQVRTSIGRLMELGPDSLTIANEKAQDRRVLLRSNIRQVEVSLRQESQVRKGLALGALGGALVAGAVALVAVGATPSCDEASDFQFCHKLTAGKLLGAIGLGAVAGAGLGFELAANHPRDVWTLARWPDAVAPPQRLSTLLPLIGLGTSGGHHVLRLGLSLAR
jgi:hypothetical protein